jgi:hypothetical protein
MMALVLALARTAAAIAAGYVAGVLVTERRVARRRRAALDLVTAAAFARGGLAVDLEAIAAAATRAAGVSPDIRLAWRTAAELEAARHPATAAARGSAVDSGAAGGPGREPDAAGDSAEDPTSG